MSINAGDVRATMTLDVGGFESGVARARAELSALDESGQRTSAAFDRLEARTASSAAAMAGAMESVGKGSAQLTELAARADQSAARVDALSQRAAEAAQQLAAARQAAADSGNALKLLEESAAASAENLQQAEQALETLKDAGTATQTELLAAQRAVQDFSAETADLAGQIQQQTAAHEANTGAVAKADARYRQLAAQLLGAEAAAGKANEKFSLLTETLGSGPVSLKGITETISQLGSSTLSSATRSLSSMAVSAMGINAGTAAGTLATSGLSAALRMLVSSLNPVSLGLTAVGAGAAYAAVRIAQAHAETEDGVASWEKLYEAVDAERIQTFTTIVDSEFQLNTDGLDKKVNTVYDEIAQALTDGEPDTPTVVSKLQESTQGMFSEVRAEIQEWYDAEMALLNLSTPEGLQKAAELSAEYSALVEKVDQLDASTSGWIVEYAGQSTEACTAALSQLESYEAELERLAKRADEMTALLQSNQRAAYTTVSNGLTADTTTVANAVQYVQFDYSTNLQYAEDDHDAQMAVLWQEYQEKLQQAATDQEKLEIDAEYSVRLEQANSAYAETRNQLATQYNQMMGDVMQGVAQSLSRSDPELGAAIEQAISGDFMKLSELDLDNSQLAENMKAFVESGVLDGVTNADLTTPEGQLEAMIRLLGQGTQQAADAAFSGLSFAVLDKSLFGAVEAEDPALQIRSLAQGINEAIQSLDGDALREQLDFFTMGLSFEGSEGNGNIAGYASGVERIAAAFDAVSAAAAAGNLDASSLQEYGSTLNDLLFVMDQLEPTTGSADFDFLNSLSQSMNALGYSTDATTVVDTLHQLWDAYSQLETLEPAVEMTPELTFNENGIPTPSLDWLEANGYYQPPESQQVEIPVDPMISSSALAAAEAEGSNLSNSAAAGAANAQGLFASAGSNAGSAFVSGIRGFLSAAAAAGTAIGSAAYNALKQSLDIQSPSRKMRVLGRYTGSGYALGIEDEITLAEASVQRLAGATMKAAADVTNNHYNNSVNVTLPGASIRSEEDVRSLSRQIGRAVQQANYGIN